MLESFRIGFRDLSEGVRLRRVWVALAQEDIGDQHKRSTLGPLWLLINYFVFIAIFLFLFQRGASIPYYASYMALGLWIWFAISEAISHGVALFVREEGYIKGTRLPLTVYVMRLVMQAALRMCYTAVGCAVIILLCGPALTIAAFASIAGVLVVFLVMPATVIIFGFLGAYFPDGQYIVSNLMRVGMFLTPVFWMPDRQSGIRLAAYQYNPFTYFVEVVRMPIFDGVVPYTAFGVCLTIGLAVWIFALFLLGRFKRNLVFVL